MKAKMFSALIATIACLTLVGASHAGIILIDTFDDTHQAVNKAAPGPDTAAAPEALGGFRTIVLTVVAGPLDATLVADGPTDFLTLSNDVGTSSTAVVGWDAAGAGLGVDLLDGFTAAERFFSLEIVSVDVGLVDLRIRIDDVFANNATVDIVSPAPGIFKRKLSSFVGAGGIDYTQVNRIELRLIGDVESDIAVDWVLVSQIPEPSTVVLLGIGILGVLGVSYRRRRS